MATSLLPLPTSFSSSPLVRLLASLGITPAAAVAQPVAEPLSQWVAWTDAIALSRVLADAPASGPAAPLAAARARDVLEQVARVRGELSDAIVHDALLSEPAPSTARRAAAADGTIDLAAYRRHYRAHQHTMEDRIGELRARVRAAVAAAAPALGRLAALDAVLDRALAVHQRRLLEKLPVMLEQRLRELHAAVAHDAPAAAAPAVGPTLQRVLLAELETRMQPVQGLVDALGADAATDVLQGPTPSTGACRSAQHAARRVLQ